MAIGMVAEEESSGHHLLDAIPVMVNPCGNGLPCEGLGLWTLLGAAEGAAERLCAMWALTR